MQSGFVAVYIRLEASGGPIEEGENGRELELFGTQRVLPEVFAGGGRGKKFAQGE